MIWNLQKSLTYKSDTLSKKTRFTALTITWEKKPFRIYLFSFWNRNYIDHIQITSAETIGIEGRANYYDKAGALRDMVPNHMFQLLALIAMEPPVTFEADVVREEKAQVLKAIQPLTGDDIHNSIIRGQYGSGMINGKNVPAYNNEKGVPADTKTETYTALKFFIQNW